MTKLLKDMPEHMERIEGNWSLKGAIQSEIKTEAEFESVSSNDDDYCISNPELLAEKVLAIVTDFVNQNYTFKGTLPLKITGILNSELNDFEDAVCPDGERHDITAIMGNKIDRIVEAILA